MNGGVGGQLSRSRRSRRRAWRLALRRRRWRASTGSALVNWFSTETLNAKGKRTYYNSFVTDLAITPDTVAELAACGRARW